VQYPRQNSKFPLSVIFLGELARALATAEELLVLLPMNQNIQKAKKKIEKAMAKKELAKGIRSKSKTKVSKTQLAKSYKNMRIRELNSKFSNAKRNIIIRDENDMHTHLKLCIILPRKPNLQSSFL